MFIANITVKVLLDTRREHYIIVSWQANVDTIRSIEGNISSEDEEEIRNSNLQGGPPEIRVVTTDDTDNPVWFHNKSVHCKQMYSVFLPPTVAKPRD